MSAPNVIPFARPRAMAAMPATFSSPSDKPTWGSAAKKPAPSMNQWSAPSESSWGFPVNPPSQNVQGAQSVQSRVGANAPTIVQPNMFAQQAVVTSGSAAPKLQPVPTPVAPLPPAPMPPAPAFQPAPPPAIAKQPLLPVASPAAGLADLLEPAHSAVPTIVARPDHVMPAGPSKWAAFERLGLRAPQLDPKQWSKHVVSAYRLLGFVILTIIVIVLVGYLVTTAFFYMSNSWVVPMAITSTDEKVVALESQLAERQNARDRIAIELDQAERTVAVQQQFQLEFAKAIKSDLEGRRAALERMHQLANVAASTRTAIRRSNNAYASASQHQMAQEWKAGLIDRNQMLAGKFQVAQISSSNLSLAERQAEYETRAQDLEAQTRSLEALLANTSSGDPLSYDVLKIKQEYEQSRLEGQKAIETRDTLKAAVEREDKLLTALKGTSYLRALGDHASVAFVPYGNLTKIDKGSSLYGCKLGMVFCHKVGTVLEILPGEVQFKHPHKDQMLRGQMVELKLSDESAASDDVLFVGGRPLLI